MFSCRRSLLSLSSLASTTALLLLLLLAVGAQAATTRYVSADGANGAYTTIQAAINAAAPGDTIVVAAGTYRESLDWEKDLTIQGAGVGQSIIDPSGGPGGRCLFTAGLTAASKIEGFTLQGGSSGGGGGAMYNNNSNLTVINCTFTSNTATVGGGMSNDFGSPTVINCAFTGNAAISVGGGMSNASSSPSVINCTFTGNTATGGGGSGGGGMYNQDGSPRMTNCTFSGNTATAYGGGMYNAFSGPTLTNCAFSGNAAGFYGGGMNNNASSTPTLTNCTFAGNTATDLGGGIFNWDGGSPTLTNCILWGNTATYGGNGIYTNLDDISSATLRHTDSQDIATPDADGNFGAAPLFVRNPFTNAPDDYGDLRLQAGSPCINVGANSAVAGGIAIDLGGDQRIANGIVDLGPYEFGSVHVNDTTPPTLTWGSRTPAPNAAGWNNTAVDIPFTAADDLSGIASLSTGSPLHFATEGEGQTQTVTVTDAVGNSRNFPSPAVNIDMTAPTTTGSATGTATSTVTLSASDSTSGVKATYYTVDGGPRQTYSVPFTLAQGYHSVQYWSVDNADNVETFQYLPVDTRLAVTVVVDKVSGKRGVKVNLSATVTQSGNSRTKLSGLSVLFVLDGAVFAGYSTTNKQGVASLSWTIPAGFTVGAHTIQATFPGTGIYSSNSGTGTLTVK